MPRVAAVPPADTAVGTTASIALCARQCPPRSRTCADSFDLHPGGSACRDASEETALEKRGQREHQGHLRAAGFSPGMGGDWTMRMVYTSVPLGEASGY